ncbi:MAG TPA: serine hydrolase domain-containing protein, partial [Pyrinomonadaceae bacterium]|nr:serine hydrolase domain-containing protein [Pyrinomonadaceae bacterium]
MKTNGNTFSFGKQILNAELQIRFYLCVLCVLCVSISVKAQGLPLAVPNAVGMSAEKLKLIDAEVEKAIADKKTPGAVVIVGRRGKIVYRKAFGNRSLVPVVEKMTVDTIFDAASLTKPVATATSIMILLERGQLRLNDRIEQFIPELKGKDSGRVTIQQLLTHTSGYQPDFDLREKWTGNDAMLKALEKEPLRQPAGTRFVYSDIGFIVLGEIVRRLEKQNNGDFENYLSANLFSQLKVSDSGFVNFYKSDTFIENFKALKTNRVAPSENIKGQQSYLGGQFDGKEGDKILHGKVHDPTAYRMGGVAGHAGLFSTADDLARYCQMILNGGTLDGVRVLSANTIALMTKPYVVSETGAARGLGWDMNTSFSGNRGELFPLGSFGHTGFTGTGVWIDPTSETFVVFMSNRVHPDGKGDVSPLRNKVATIVASSIQDLKPEKIREAEANYQAQ